MILLYVNEDGLVFGSHSEPQKLTDEQKKDGYLYEGVLPQPKNIAGKVPVMKYDKLTEEITYEYVDRPLTLDEKVDKLKTTTEKVKTATERYNELNLETASIFDVKGLKSLVLKEICNKKIESGFISPSIGHKFGFKAHDQSNIQQQLLVFLSNPNETETEWKTEDAGIVKLTKEQFLNLVPEGKEHVRRHVDYLWSLIPLVQLAETNEDVDAIVWKDEDIDKVV